MCDEEKLDQTDAIIDLGTGNGVMLRELDEFGFSNLTGVDYSQAQADFGFLMLVIYRIQIEHFFFSSNGIFDFFLFFLNLKIN